MPVMEFKKGLKQKVTENFFSTEFDCNCKYPECKITYIDLDHVKKLEEKRKEFNAPILINSGFRCVMHNRDIGGKPGSIHMTGKATDIRVPGYDPKTVQEKCEDFDGLGSYSSFTHVDSRYGGNGDKKSRWNG